MCSGADVSELHAIARARARENGTERTSHERSRRRRITKTM
jgi:hypothetical protein